MKSRAYSAVVLLVDDDPQVTQSLQRVLRREAFTILTAISAADATDLLARQHFDIVISDEQMPGMSGSVFLSHVRKLYPHTIRMILSGQANLEAAVRAINEGEVYRFFLKPCNSTDLIHTMQQALAQKRLEDQSRRLLREYERQQSVLKRVTGHSAGILRVDLDDQGAIVVDESDGDGDVYTLLEEIERAIESTP